MPKVPAAPLVEERDYRHPILGPAVGSYFHQIIGDAGGLTQFGVHLEVLPPGARSSFRHWHETEDEMIYLLSGELVLIEDEQSLLRPGDAACWPAGLAIGHCLENRSDTPATYLTVGTRKHHDVIHYPDHDLTTIKDGTARSYLHHDGRPYPTKGETK